LLFFVVLAIMNTRKALLPILSLFISSFQPLVAQDTTGYQLPPQSIAELVDAPMVPKIELNEQRSWMAVLHAPRFVDMAFAANPISGDRKSTRLNSSHVKISYAVF